MLPNNIIVLRFSPIVNPEAEWIDGGGGNDFFYFAY